MKQMTIEGVTFKPKGAARSMKAHAITRALNNYWTPGFNSKFKHPRRLRTLPNLAP
jgi:hypothetical protein